MKKLIYLFILLLMGCDAKITGDETINLAEPPPSNVLNAGTLSGGAYSTGGEHYKTVHAVGNGLGSGIQTSENGRYQIK